MFRELTRKKQAIPQTECIAILKQTLRGVLSVRGDDDYPYGMPLNHYYCEADGRLYFHGGMSGHRIDAVRRHNKVSYCVMDEGVRQPGEWALHFRSVIVFGRMEPVTDTAQAMHIARCLSRQFTHDEDYIAREIARAGARTLVCALVPEQITGKRVTES